MLGERFANCSLDSFETYDDGKLGQKEMLAKLQTIVGHMQEFVKAGRSLFWFGTTGTGKDHCMAAMIREAMKHEIFCHVEQGQSILETKDDRPMCWKTATILAISDVIPPLGSVAAWELPRLFAIVDRRYRERHPTWITMNALSLSDVEQRLSTPIYDRLMERAVVFNCRWPSYRTRNLAAKP